MPRIPALSRRATLVLSGAALAAPFVSRPAHAAPVVWRFYTFQTPDSPGVKILAQLTERVKEATSGQFIISLATAGRMGIDTIAMSQAVGTNAVPMGDDGYYNSFLPAGGVPRLPMLVPDRVAFARGVKAMRSFLLTAYAARDCVLLGYTFYPRLLTWSRLRIDSFASVAGQRVRSVNAEHAEFLRRLSAVPVSIPTADIPGALESGAIDTVFATAAAVQPWRKFLKSGYNSGPNYTDSVLIANKAAFTGLAKPLQDALLAAVHAAETAITDAFFNREDDLLKTYAGDGLKLAERQTDDVTTVTQRLGGMWDEWTRVRGRDAQDLLFSFRRAMEDAG